MTADVVEFEYETARTARKKIAGIEAGRERIQIAIGAPLDVAPVGNERTGHCIECRIDIDYRAPP